MLIISLFALIWTFFVCHQVWLSATVAASWLFGKLVVSKLLTKPRRNSGQLAFKQNSKAAETNTDLKALLNNIIDDILWYWPLIAATTRTV